MTLTVSEPQAQPPSLDFTPAGGGGITLDLTDADLFVSERLREQFFEGLGDLGVDVIDMGPVYRADEQPCYWSQDLHINLRGHELIAEALGADTRRRIVFELAAKGFEFKEPGTVTDLGAFGEGRTFIDEDQGY